MQSYDAVIVGAGPAGGQCARQLALSGKKVLVLEKSKDFTINNYSSGGAPLSIMEAYALPQHIVSTYWDKLALRTTREMHHWTSGKPVGVILDFKQLRHFLTEEASKHAGEIRLGCTFINHTQGNGYTLVHLQQQGKRAHEIVQTRVLVDATGSERDVLSQKAYDKSKALASTGIEYHVEVDDFIYQRYAETLSFFLGHRWMPQGYAWIFPVKKNILKVGIIRYFLHEQIVPHDLSMRNYLDHLMLQCFGSLNLPIHDKHGKTLYYTYKQKDLHYNNNIIAIGDAVSTLNPLAAEGIRHAMESGNIAAKHIIAYLENREYFDRYPSDLQQYYGLKWRLSEILMNRIYREKNDRKLDLMLRAFKFFSFNEIIDLGFNYKWHKALKFYMAYKGLNLWHLFRC